MKLHIAFATVLATTLVGRPALPCGAPFGNGVNVDPKQDIVVVHKAGVETYVFQPRFCGNASEFGLVLPVPGKLSAQPSLATAAVFAKVVEMSQPLYVDVSVCEDPYNDGRTGGFGLAADGGGHAPTVVSSGSVGFLDYAQLDTPSVDALTAWLTQNGYPYDAQATAAFDYYVQKGWYFVTFKVNQGAVGSASVCKDLGPIKLSFPTELPVVPTRMATARSKDTSGLLSYATSFSWRVFGITDGSQQVVFASPSYSRVVGFSGLVGEGDVSGLDGLAQVGDRLTKLTMSFNYGSTDADVALAVVAGTDYRETVTRYHYVTCTDAGVPGDTTSLRQDDGCSFTSSPSKNMVVPLAVLGALLALRRRRR